MTWEIFVGIASIVGFITTVTAPMIKLNSNLTKLNDHLEVLKSSLEDFKHTNEKSHKRIWEHNGEQDSKINKLDERIDNHDTGLSSIETKIDMMH